MCLNGMCTSSPLAPVGDCIFGDDVIVNGDNLLNIILTSPQMTCPVAIDYVSSGVNEPAQFGPAYCFKPDFYQTCCNTCKSTFIQDSSTSLDSLKKSFIEPFLTKTRI